MKRSFSPQFSFAGYSVKEWLAGTKDTFKMTVAALGGVAAYFVDVAPAPYNVVLAPVIAAGIKWVLDAVDFWVSDVSLKKNK